MNWILDETESTQNFLKLRLGEPENRISHLDFVLAHHQTSGRGRQGRSWISEPGNLFISIYLKDLKLPLTWIPHFVSLALLNVFLSYEVPLDRIRIKWTNDLLIDGARKISGILCEKLGDGVIAGIGVNLLSAPDLAERKTISLLELVPSLKKEGLNLEFKDRLIQALKVEPKLDSLKHKYEQASLMNKGDALHWEDLQTRQKGEGEFLRFGDFGELIAQTAQGERSLLSEEVHFIKMP